MADSYDPAIHHRRSIHLKGYDYATAGAYFLTLCAQGRHHLFGEIVGGDMLLNELGDIVTEEWARTPDVRHEVVLDAYVVMPNHLHGVLLIDRDRAKMRTANRAYAIRPYVAVSRPNGRLNRARLQGRRHPPRRRIVRHAQCSRVAAQLL